MENKQIAARLDIGLRTVELRRHTAAEKLDLGDMPLIVWAARHPEALPAIPPEPQFLAYQPAEPPKARKPRYKDPTPAEIAERAAEVRRGAQPCSA
jgi:hypothetical protein